MVDEEMADDILAFGRPVLVRRRSRSIAADPRAPRRSPAPRPM